MIRPVFLFFEPWYSDCMEWYEKVAQPYTPQQRGRIIFLNGVTSSGKSTIGKALHKALLGRNEVFKYFSLDSFGYGLTATESGSEVLSQYDIEVEWPKMVFAFNKTIPVLAEAGNDVIVDHVFHSRFWGSHVVEQIKEENVLFVGVRCPIDEVARREKDREDRPNGMAAFQEKDTHRFSVYDVEVDTFNETTNQSVDTILAKVDEWDDGKQFTGIHDTYTQFKKPQ